MTLPADPVAPARSPWPGQAPHIAGHAAALSATQRELLARAAEVGRLGLAPHAARHDRDASFPFDSFDALRRAGLLALAVPAAHGGLGADFASCALVIAELGRHCAATALCFSMHVSACLSAGLAADLLDMSAAQRAEHERHRSLHFARIVRDGKLYAQPFSEGGAAAAGKAPWATLARRVDGGYRLSGRKIFASLAGAADFYAVLCTPDQPGATLQDALYLAVPAGAPGLQICGEWDPLGMRGTVSRQLLLHDVFVADAERLLPEGLHHPLAQRYPYLYTVQSPTYLGLAQAAYDFSVLYLRGELPGMGAVKRRMYPTKQAAVAEMRVKLEQTRALFLQTVGEARIDPDDDARQRLYAAHHTVMENAHAVCALALRTCGGQAALKSLALERLFRDARCGSLMLPWTAELCLDRLGRECLYGGAEGDERIE
ncbi:MAG TPA: acyl-CoA dehydrogenase family protein [Rubrivivax sp.]|uniref:acyl-CoA dehydrogenase family protein n=1 Tax=Kouleothrix sp. TaxID=2779161 RepID=UPI002BAFC9AE|nr:acyl-CoA dehydrogenase family protein [Rubrivivax sp.]HPO19594.1 acyl-CoA dehydrogenase family protein [Rubrivivax sp.]